MQIIKEIYHDDLGLDKSKLEIKYEIRKAARAVLLNEAGQVAMMYVGKDDYYKLPGGGLENEETIQAALRREIYEEVGAKLQIIQEIGVVMEYREDFEQLQISYNYLCKTKGELAAPQLTANELNHGFRLVWMNLEEGIQAVSSYTGEKYVAKFITYRDVCILQQAKILLES